MVVELIINNQNVDLFKDENIVINALTKDLQDPTKVFSDYSQSFSVPASDNNNILFKHFYNPLINDSIDIRQKQDAIILVDSMLFRKGKIICLGAQIKGGNISSYKIQFIGELSSLSESLGDFKLEDLSFVDLSFAYSFDEVAYRLAKSSVNVSKDLIFTLLDSRFRWFVSDPKETPEDEINKNALLGVFWTELSSAVSIDYIFKAIGLFRDIKINLSAGIQSKIKDMYLFCDYVNGEVKTDALSPYVLWWYKSGSVLPKEVFHYDKPIEGTYPVIIDIVEVFPDPQSMDLPYRVYAYDIDNNRVIYQYDKDPKKMVTGNYGFVFRLGTEAINVRYFVETFYPLSFKADLQDYKGGLTVMGNYDASVFMPDLSLVDFMTSFVKMYNLVIIADGNNYDLMTYGEWKNKGVTYDITDYVKNDSFEVGRTNLPSSVSFKFAENDSDIMEVFNVNNNHYYGDLTYDFKDSKYYTSDKKEIELSFQNSIFERLTYQSTGQLTNVVSGKVSEGIPLLFYNINTILESHQIKFGRSNGYLLPNLNTPSHVQSREVTNKNSLVWGNEIDEYTYKEIEQTLYKVNYETDVSNIYSKHTRVLKNSAILPTSLLLKIQNNDNVIIDGVKYNIDKMDINLTEKNIEFELSYFRL